MVLPVGDSRSGMRFNRYSAGNFNFGMINAVVIKNTPLFMIIRPFSILACSLMITASSFAQNSLIQNVSEKEANTDVVTSAPTSSPVLVHDDEDSEPKAKRKTHYGKNILSVAPFQFTEAGIGFSFAYERFIDKDDIISFVLPVLGTFDPFSESSSGVSNGGSNDYTYYVMPGLKFYPTGSRGKVRYALGPSLVLGAGEKTLVSYNYYGSNNETRAEKLVMGITINNSINFRPTQHMYLGLDLGLGFTYVNQFDNQNKGITALVNGAFKIGYIF